MLPYILCTASVEHKYTAHIFFLYTTMLHMFFMMLERFVTSDPTPPIAFLHERGEWILHGCPYILDTAPA